MSYFRSWCLVDGLLDAAGLAARRRFFDQGSDRRRSARSEPASQRIGRRKRARKPPGAAMKFQDVTSYFRSWCLVDGLLDAAGLAARRHFSDQGSDRRRSARNDLAPSHPRPGKKAGKPVEAADEARDFTSYFRSWCLVDGLLDAAGLAARRRFFEQDSDRRRSARGTQSPLYDSITRKASKGRPR
jgi:hypothetical protein